MTTTNRTAPKGSYTAAQTHHHYRRIIPPRSVAGAVGMGQNIRVIKCKAAAGHADADGVIAYRGVGMRRVIGRGK